MQKKVGKARAKAPVRTRGGARSGAVRINRMRDRDIERHAH